MERRAFSAAVLVLLASTVLAGVVHADHVLGGTKLTLRRTQGTGAMSLVLRDPALPLPPPGGADDPSQVGMVVTLFGRGSDTRASLVAPPGLGRPGWTVRSSPRVSYAYANPAAPPGDPLLSVASLRDGNGLRIRAKSAGLMLAMAEGAVAVRVELGTTRVCALFDGPAVRRDEPGRFVARDADASGLASCDDDALAASPCEQSASCGGSCPGDAVCAGVAGVVGCTCVSPHQPCGLTGPACNGECPVGEECASLGGFPAPSCGCLPFGSTPCGGAYPSCGDGDCPAGTGCYQDTFVCCGDVAIPYCACLSEPPPEPCPGGCPEGWSCVGPAPGFPAICLPPFCNDGAGAPICGGTCTLSGTVCTAIGGVCLCLDPCIGGGTYPACGGSCTDAGFTCRAVEGQCVCVP